MIDLTVNKKLQDKNISYCREKGILLPTFEMMRDPQQVPSHIKESLKSVELWQVNPLNLFRIIFCFPRNLQGARQILLSFQVGGFPPELTRWVLHTAA